MCWSTARSFIQDGLILLILDRSKYTLEVEEKSLNLLVYEFEVLLDLVNFELVVAVSDGSIGILVVVVAAGVDGVVEELIPVEVLVVFS